MMFKPAVHVMRNDIQTLGTGLFQKFDLSQSIQYDQTFTYCLLLILTAHPPAWAGTLETWSEHGFA